MNRRHILLIIVCTVLSAVFWLSRPHPTKGPPELKLPALHEITSISLTRTGHPDVLLTQGKTRLELAGVAIEAFAQRELQIAFANPLILVPTQPAPPDLRPLGLSEHALTATFTTSNQVSTFRIGQLISGRQTLLLSLDHPGWIYRAPGNLRRALDRDPQAWHDLKVLDINSNDIREIRHIFRGEVRFIAQRSARGQPLLLAYPADTPLERDALEALAHALTTARATAPSSTPFNELIRLDTTTFNGVTAQLALSPLPYHRGALAQVLPNGPVVELPQHLSHFLTQDILDLRERRLFPERLGMPRELILNDPQGTARVVLDPGGGYAVAGGPPTREVFDVVKRMLAVSALSYVPSGDETPLLSWTLKATFSDRVVLITSLKAYGKGLKVRSSDAPTLDIILSQRDATALLALRGYLGIKRSR